MSANNTLMKHITNLQKTLTTARFHHWMLFEVGRPQWWLLVAALIIPWIVWGVTVNKQLVKEVFLYGALVSFVITILDAVGTDLGLWAYVYKAIPLFNRCVAIDVGILPVIYMMVFQCCRTWKTFMMVHIILAAVFSFVLEPLVVRMGICIYYHWSYIYSFPIYIALAAAAKYTFMKLEASNGSVRRTNPA